VTQSATDALLASIRKRCKSGLWSQGVSLARAGAVAVESQSAEEIVLRVRAPGRVVPPTVVLYPTENEWECDCPSRVSPCEHVAAAAIVLGEPKGQGEAPAAAPSGALGARVGYRFLRASEGLRLSRVLIAADGAETPLEGALRARLASPTAAAELQIEEADLRADGLLEIGGGGARGVLSPTKLDGLMQILAGAPRVTVDGVAATISEEAILPCATLVDAPGGEVEVRLTITADPRVRAVVAPGVALCEDEGHRALHRLGETELTGVRLQQLPVRRTFGAAELGAAHMALAARHVDPGRDVGERRLDDLARLRQRRVDRRRVRMDQIRPARIPEPEGAAAFLAKAPLRLRAGRALARLAHHRVIAAEVLLAAHLHRLGTGAEVDGIAAAARGLAADRAVAVHERHRARRFDRERDGTAMAGPFEMHVMQRSRRRAPF